MKWTPPIPNVRPYLRPRAQKGQTLIFILMIMVIMVFIALWNFDLHKILHVKAKSRIAGDSAALAGARWQGMTINTIGNLNVMQAVAITEALSRDPINPDLAESQAIANLEKRLAFVGPMTGMVAVQQAAKNNRTYSNDAYTQAVR